MLYPHELISWYKNCTLKGPQEGEDRKTLAFCTCHGACYTKNPKRTKKKASGRRTEQRDRVNLPTVARVPRTTNCLVSQGPWQTLPSCMNLGVTDLSDMQSDPLQGKCRFPQESSVWTERNVFNYKVK